MRVPIILIGVGLALGFSTGAGAQFIPGDINDDGNVDIADPTVLRRHLAGLGPGIQQGVPDPNAPRFVDNGDGTISDDQTGLMWEKKSDDPNDIHYSEDSYIWSLLGSTVPDGTAFSVFLSSLNGTSLDGTTIIGCFAGYCDWRLPTIVELQTILIEPYPCGSFPCIDPIFGPTDGSPPYWSASTTGGPDGAWSVFFGSGLVVRGNNVSDNNVRAVRSGP